ncbi:alpha/beta hydrolase fold domain-containing protein [Mycobacterium sp. ITM-2016-00316]|uniref:alpha/beta hydrolase fold domain-containing protein n=1 Tax=Mycobacterium sp. ITM-2016-00316 TaxID=2099695 RepID=UPI000CFA0B63|nr:alpha/beta hydrolase fold domain-containing protein [Mycobacterium sp. ITM-2016-00316]WNG82426.1 alpha/beta hydrolase fold domain-containing protein [Mycobacterium sp. ITM-2016-00316]
MLRGAEEEFHPELRRYARMLPRTLVTPLTLPVFQRLPPIRVHRPPPGVSTAVMGSGVTVRVFRPPYGDNGSALLWIHGGGFMLGDARMDDALCARLAAETEATVAAVDYRLAPAHPYPAALDDCYEALVWLSDHPDVDPVRLAVGGASAGGGLAAALALLARDRGEISLAAQLLVYPMLDDRTGLHADPHRAARRLWNATSNRLAWSAYLGGVAADTVAPARRGDLSGLAPAWIGVGTLDVLHDEAVRYGERLRASGVCAQVCTVPGAFHGFDAVAPKARVARKFVHAQRIWLRERLAV